MYQYRTHIHYTCAHSIQFLPATATQWGRMVTVTRLNPSAMPLGNAQSSAILCLSPANFVYSVGYRRVMPYLCTPTPTGQQSMRRVFANSALIES